MLYQRESFMLGVLAQVFTRQSNKLDSYAEKLPPFTITRPSSNVAIPAQNMSCVGRLYSTNCPVAGFHVAA